MVSSLVSPSPLTRPATATDSTGNLTPPTTSTGTSATWTSEQEVRLAYCQDQLKQAQKKWSDRQELWIREVDHLLEQRRLYLKSQKTSNKEPSLRLWKRTRSWKALSRTQSAVDTACGKDGHEEGEREGEEKDAEDSEEGEEEEDDDGLALGNGNGKGVGSGSGSGRDRGRGIGVAGVRRSESMPQAPTTRPTSSSTSFFSPPPPTSPTTPSSTTVNPFKRIIRRMSTATGGGGRRHSDSVAGGAAGAGEVL